MVRHNFLILTWHPPIKRTPLSSTLGYAEQLCRWTGLGISIFLKWTSISLFTGGTFYYNLDNFHWYLNSYTSFFKIRRYYSETCLNQTLSKQKTCLNWTLSKQKTCLNWTLSKQKTCLNQTDFTVPSTKCLCNLNLCKPNTCLNWTNSLVPKGFGWDRFYCTYNNTICTT